MSQPYARSVLEPLRACGSNAIRSIADPGLAARRARARRGLMTGAHMQGANREHANLAGADLAGADLPGAELDGANLERDPASNNELHGRRLSVPERKATAR